MSLEQSNEQLTFLLQINLSPSPVFGQQSSASSSFCDVDKTLMYVLVHSGAVRSGPADISFLDRMKVWVVESKQEL